MEKVGTAGKATVVAGMSCRQRGLKHRTVKVAPALPRDKQWYRGPRCETFLPWSLWCDLQLNQAVPVPLQMCRVLLSPSHSPPLRWEEREEEHAWDWSLLYRGEELQNPWHAVSRIYMEVAEGDSVQGHSKAGEDQRGRCLHTSWHHAHLSDSLTALLLNCPTERGAPEESGGTSRPMVAMCVLWPFRLVRHPITMLLSCHPWLKTWNARGPSKHIPKWLFQSES